jgi:eukaryotic-like serine/threonine-protein kinase
MPQPPNEEPKSQRSVLQILGERTGLSSKVLLPDSDSEHGGSPVVAPGSATARLVPQGRGNYQLLGEIARGGMGVILKGHDTDLGRDVAVKVLDGELAKRPEVVQRFVEEAQIGGQLQHPGIVPVYELGLMADERPYFTMKLIKGRTLAALLQQRKNPGDNRGRLLAIFESVCQTVAYAHSKGVLHRDLKPANVMVGAFGEVQVVDWGLAKVLRRGGVADEKRAKERVTIHTVIETVRSGPGSSGSDSMVGSVMGTPAYMAPEQAQGEIEKLDERADVFSLGAILCELLTGQPPYVESEGQHLVTLAARAELDPARARIEACEADTALKRLCLDCLMPARAARPANAEEVAKALHAYLTSTEERAAKAELAAEKERIKAAEERRARRLTLALGGTIAAALLLGGGGLWWVEHERAKRSEQTRAQVEIARSEALEFGRAGKPVEALAAAQRALALAESNSSETALQERMRGFVQQAEEDARAAERERSLHEKDETLRRTLLDLRLKQLETVNNQIRESDLDAAFAKAFQDYGVDLEGDDVVPALQRIRERAIAEEVALSLDDWARLRRRVHGSKSEKAENLFSLAMDLDPDPGRQRLRQAIFDGDLKTLLELAAPENLPQLAPGSIWVLSATLWDAYRGRRPDVYRMYDQARHLYPDDFLLQAIGGEIYQIAGRFDDSLVCRTAALSLRPDSPLAHINVADSLLFMGRLTEALESARACVAAFPDFATGYYELGLTEVQLGEYGDALAHVKRALELDDNPDWRPDLLALRFHNGLASKSEIQHALRTETAPVGLATCMLALLDHSDPAQRDPQFVLDTLRDGAGLFAGAEWIWEIETVARIRIEDWNGALSALGSHFAPPAVLLLTPGAFDFVRALVYARAGRGEAARESYARGMSGWNALTGGNPAAWANSDVMRWRREAEAALPR